MPVIDGTLWKLSHSNDLDFLVRQVNKSGGIALGRGAKIAKEVNMSVQESSLSLTGSGTIKGPIRIDLGNEAIVLLGQVTINGPIQISVNSRDNLIVLSKIQVSNDCKFNSLVNTANTNLSADGLWANDGSFSFGGFTQAGCSIVRLKDALTMRNSILPGCEVLFVNDHDSKKVFVGKNYEKGFEGTYNLSHAGELTISNMHVAKKNTYLSKDLEPSDDAKQCLDILSRIKLAKVVNDRLILANAEEEWEFGPIRNLRN